jgi:hypothetical protein
MHPSPITCSRYSKKPHSRICTQNDSRIAQPITPIALATTHYDTGHSTHKAQPLATHSHCTNSARQSHSHRITDDHYTHPHRTTHIHIALHTSTSHYTHPHRTTHIHIAQPVAWRSRVYDNCADRQTVAPTHTHTHTHTPGCSLLALALRHIQRILGKVSASQRVHRFVGLLQALEVYLASLCTHSEGDQFTM